MEQTQNQNPFEKMANERISKMDFKTFMDLILTYKTLNMFNPNNPLYMYICYFVPYTPKINKKQKKLLFQNNLNYASMTNAIKYLTQMKKMSKLFEIKEKPIQFTLRNCKNLQRFQKVETQLRNDEYNKTIIKIQKHMRGFLKRISLVRIIDYIIIERLLLCILRIQRQYRRFACRRTFKVNHLINLILKDRIQKSDKLKYILHSYKMKVEAKKKLFINAVLKERNDKLLFLQGFFKAKFAHNTISQLLMSEKTKYIITYPYNAHTVKLKLYLDNKLKMSRLYDFEFCSVRKIFILKINQSDIKPGKYFCQFIVDNYISSDERYDLVEGKDGHYYNIIEFNMKGKNPYGSTNTIHTSINVTRSDSSNNNSFDSPQLVSNKKFPFNNNNYNYQNNFINNMNNNGNNNYMNNINNNNYLNNLNDNNGNNNYMNNINNNNYLNNLNDNNGNNNYMNNNYNNNNYLNNLNNKNGNNNYMNNNINNNNYLNNNLNDNINNNYMNNSINNSNNYMNINNNGNNNYMNNMNNMNNGNNNFYNYNGYNNYNNFNYGYMFQKPNAYGKYINEEEFIHSLKNNLQGKTSEFSNEFSNVD